MKPLTQKIEGKRRVVPDVFKVWESFNTNADVTYNSLIRIVDQINYECGMPEGVFTEGNPYWVYEDIRITLRLEIGMVHLDVHPEHGEPPSDKVRVTIGLNVHSSLTGLLNNYLDAYRIVWTTLQEKRYE